MNRILITSLIVVSLLSCDAKVGNSGEKLTKPTAEQVFLYTGIINLAQLRDWQPATDTLDLWIKGELNSEQVDLSEMQKCLGEGKYSEGESSFFSGAATAYAASTPASWCPALCMIHYCPWHSPCNPPGLANCIATCK